MELVPLEPRPAPPADDASSHVGGLSHPDSAPGHLAKPVRLEVDVFLAQAAREYRQGRIDKVLWDQAAQEFDGGDKQAIVTAYLRLRARSLKRKPREDEDRKTAGTKASAPRRASVLSGPRLRYGIAGLAIGFAAFIGAWIAFPDDDAEPPTAAAATPPRPVVIAKASAAQPAPVSQTSSSSRNEAGIELEAKVRGLEKSGNWNVLVLHAAEWTRKEPENSMAWMALSNGYLRLRQWDDSHDAATRAVKAAPDDATSWRNLGHVETALERWPEARNAFEKSLAVKGDDLDALCGAARVATAQGRSKDAAELVSRVTRAGTGCPDVGDAVRSAALAASQRKPAPPAN